MREIMVGIRDLEVSHAPVEWAMSYAERSPASVHLVHVLDVTWGIVPAEYTEAAILEAEQLLRALERIAADRHPAVSIRSSVLVGLLVEELARATESRPAGAGSSSSWGVRGIRSSNHPHGFTGHCSLWWCRRHAVADERCRGRRTARRQRGGGTTAAR